MSKKTSYNEYINPTLEIMNSIKVGDLIKVDGWKRPMKVMGVSKNYFVMTSKIFGDIFYSVCEKIPWGGIDHNEMRGGYFHCGRDDSIFGSPYDLNNTEEIEQYLQEFEAGDIELSVRSATPIYRIYIKSYNK